MALTTFGGYKRVFQGISLTDSIDCTTNTTLVVNQATAKNHLADASTIVAADLIWGDVVLSGTPGAKTLTLPTGAVLGALLTGCGAGTFLTCRITNGSNGIVTIAAGASGSTILGSALTIPVNEVCKIEFTFTSATAYNALIEVFNTPATNINIGTDANAKTITIGNTTGATAVVINSGTGSTQINNGLQVVPKTVASITADGATTLTAQDSGGTFGITIGTNTTMSIVLPTPAQGLKFKFVRLDATNKACTISDASAHLYGNFMDTGAVTYAIVTQVSAGTTITFVASGSIGDWVSFEGVDATHYLVNGGCLSQSKMTIS